MIRTVPLLLFLALPAFSAQNEFSGDSAYANLKVLAGEIGPRPMGSPAEHRALEFAVARFAAYGCQEAYIMPLSVADATTFTSGNGTNTRTGIAVGVSRGTAGRIIIIGGHIDSAGPTIPGANDDGSGAASVIELARDICAREHESTVVFCCWGGEEFGLIGSDYFAQHYPLIDSVALMLQIDMADGSGPLDADPDAGYQVSAPRWLVEAAYDIFYNDLKYKGLRYPTQFSTLNSSFSGATGSDHIPFLDKGIPSIDFTSDISYPIHQPLDNLSNFNPYGLKRTGELVLRLFDRFDGGVPSRTTEKYWLLQFGTSLVFVSHPVLWAFICFTFLFAVAVLVFGRGSTSTPASPERIRWSGAKIVLFTLIVQFFVWYSENVVGIIRGYRYPWVENFGGFALLGIIGGMIGFWLVLRMAGKLRLSLEPYSFYARAIVLLGVFTGLLSLASPELGPYAAVGLLLVSLAVLIRPPAVKLILVVLGGLMLFRLIFSEDFPFLERMLMRVPKVSTLASMLYNLWFVVFFAILSIPFAYAFAGICRDAGSDFLRLRKFREPRWLAVLGLAAVVVVVYLLQRPVYDNLWQRSVQVQERFDLRTDSSAIELTSAEYLRGLHVHYGQIDTTVEGRSTSLTVQPPVRPVMRWCSIEDANVAAESPGGADSLRVIRHMVEIHSVMRPFTVNLSYYSPRPMTLTSPWSVMGDSAARPSRFKLLSWYSFPDTALVVPVTFTLGDSQKVVETAEVTFDSLAYPLTMEREFTYFTPKSIVTRTDTIDASRAGTEINNDVR